MSNANYHPIVVRDERINSITTDLPIELRKAGSQNTYQSQNSNSASTTGITYNVTAPSENVVLDRHIKMSTKAAIKIGIAAGSVVVGSVCFKYGVTEALAAFPINNLITTATVSINTATMTVNTQDVFGVLSKMHDQEDFDMYHCPTMLDQKFKNFSDMPLESSSPFGSFLQSKGDITPRGAHPLDSFRIEKFLNNVSAAIVTEANTDAQITTALTCNDTANNRWVIDLVFTTVEPVLFLSPLIFGKSNNNSGLYGVNHFDLLLNLDTTAKRVFCSSSNIPMTVSLTSVSECKLLLNYITPQPSDLISPTNVVPFTDYQRYITADNTAINPRESKVISSNSTQFNSIPSKIYVCVRKQLNTMTLKDSNSFLAIKQVAIQFNNMSGILSSATQHDLFVMSKRNGLKQSVYEFFGKASTGNMSNKATAGSILILDPVDFGLPEYLTSGSTGNFNFQINVTCENTDGVAVTVELMILTQNDGVFITQNGQSTKQTALFTKDITAKATMAQFGESLDYVRKFSDGPSLTNVPLQNVSKSGAGAMSAGSLSAGSGAMSAGSYSRSALQRIH